MRPRTLPRQANRRVLVAAGVAAIAFMVLLSACGGGGSGVPSSGSDVSAAGVTLTLPDGWAFQDNGEEGLVLAERDADLRADAPQGPRLTVEPGGTALPDPDALVSAIAGADPEAAPNDVVLQPQVAPVGADEEGVVIDLREELDGSLFIRRYVIVNVDGVNVYQFVLEAPEELWELEKHGLGLILAGASFEAS